MLSFKSLSWWNELSREAQIEYLRQHKKSEFRGYVKRFNFAHLVPPTSFADIDRTPEGMKKVAELRRQSLAKPYDGDLYSAYSDYADLALSPYEYGEFPGVPYSARHSKSRFCDMITPAQRKALNSIGMKDGTVVANYKGVGTKETRKLNSEISYFLRNGTVPENSSKEEMEKNVETLKKCINKFKLPEDLVCFRGTGLDIDFHDNLKVGDVFKDEGFVSVSIDREEAGKFGATKRETAKTLFHITVPKGYHAMPLAGGLTQYMDDSLDHEAEYILKPNCKFRVDAIKAHHTATIGRNYVYLTVISDGDEGPSDSISEADKKNPFKDQTTGDWKKLYRGTWGPDGTLLAGESWSDDYNIAKSYATNPNDVKSYNEYKKNKKPVPVVFDARMEPKKPISLGNDNGKVSLGDVQKALNLSDEELQKWVWKIQNRELDAVWSLSKPVKTSYMGDVDQLTSVIADTSPGAGRKYEDVDEPKRAITYKDTAFIDTFALTDNKEVLDRLRELGYDAVHTKAPYIEDGKRRVVNEYMPLDKTIVKNRTMGLLGLWG